MADNENLEEEKKTLQYTCDIQEVSTCERHVVVTIPASEVKRYFDTEFATLAKDTPVPGFRPGKAPRKILEKRYRKDAEKRVKSALIYDALTRINDEELMTAINEPDFDVEKVIVPDNADFIFEYNIEVRPEFELPNWKGLTLEKPIQKITSQDVDKMLYKLQDDNASLQESEEPAQLGDYVAVKIQFLKNGQSIAKSKHLETICIRPTLNFVDCVINDFDKAMVGAKVGDDVIVKTHLMLTSPNPILAGSEVEAHFHVKTIFKKVLPEIDEDFLYNLGGYKDLADLRDKLQDLLEKQSEYKANQSLRKQITQKLLDSADWTLPPRLLKNQSEREFQRAILEMRRNGYFDRDIAVYANKIRQNSNETTEQALREHFILEKIAEIEEVVDTPEDYNHEIMLIAAQTGQSARKVRTRMEQNGDMDLLRNQIIENKVIELILNEATVTEVVHDDVKQEDEEAIDMAGAGEENEAQDENNEKNNE